MILTLHTPTGIINIDSDTVTDEELEAIGWNRDILNNAIPRDPLAEIDEMKGKIADYDTLKAKVAELETK